MAKKKEDKKYAYDYEQKFDSQRSKKKNDHREERRRKEMQRWECV